MVSCVAATVQHCYYEAHGVRWQHLWCCCWGLLCGVRALRGQGAAWQGQWSGWAVVRQWTWYGDWRWPPETCCEEVFREQRGNDDITKTWKFNSASSGKKREMIPNVSQIHCCTKTVCYSLRADDVGVSSPWHRDITRSELGKWALVYWPHWDGELGFCTEFMWIERSDLC